MSAFFHHIRARIVQRQEGPIDVRSRSEKEDHPTQRIQSASFFPYSLTTRIQEYLHQGVRKPHLGPVDGAIAHRLDQRQQLMVPRVLHDLVQRNLFQAVLALHLPSQTRHSIKGSAP